MPKHWTPAEYAQLGAELECDASPAELAAFYRRYNSNGDVILAYLAQFATWKCTARCERLAGRIDAAQLAETECEAWYGKLPSEYRW